MELQAMSSSAEEPLVARLRRITARVPGARLLRESLFGTPGSWLYHASTLSWLSDPALVRQLPRAYRFFARYCAVQRHQPIGAEPLLRGIIALRRRFAPGDGIVALRIGELIAFLDLEDPRFLRVPREIDALPSLLRRFLRPGDTFIDVGANHGTFSVVASSLVGSAGLVVSIEPQPRLADVVQRSLAQGQARFEVHAIACGDRSQEVELYIPSATSGSAGVFGQFSAISHHRTIRVAMRRLDDVIDFRRLPGRVLLKADVEGSEQSFLLGATELIRATTPAMLIEMNEAAMRSAGSSRTTLVKMLLDLGYDRFVTPEEATVERPLAEASTDRDVIALPAARGAGRAVPEH
jgi:FkbM family methyltransferase